MGKKENVHLSIVIINALCAFIWSLVLALDFVRGETGGVSFILHILCVIAWDICAVVWIIRYINSKEESEA